MKIEIGPDGQMKIKPESDIENYFLTKWWDDWRNHKVTLCVEVNHPNVPESITPLMIEAD